MNKKREPYDRIAVGERIRHKRIQLGLSLLPLVLTKMNIQNPNASGVLYNVFTLIGVLVGLWIYGIATRRAYLLWTFYVSAAILTVMILWTSMSPLVALIMITAFAHDSEITHMETVKLK